MAFGAIATILLSAGCRVDVLSAGFFIISYTGLCADRSHAKVACLICLAAIRTGRTTVARLGWAPVVSSLPPFTTAYREVEANRKGYDYNEPNDLANLITPPVPISTTVESSKKGHETHLQKSRSAPYGCRDRPAGSAESQGSCIPRKGRRVQASRWTTPTLSASFQVPAKSARYNER